MLGVLRVPALAQQRPLQTEDPETIGAGRILLEAGVDYESDVYYPLSGLRGNLFTVPPMGISIGVSSIAEIQIDGGLYQKLSITEQVPNAPLSHLLDARRRQHRLMSTTSNIGAKVRFLSETPGRPAMAIPLLDASAECRQRVRPRQGHAGLQRVVGSSARRFSRFASSATSGMLILGNPTKLAAQDDLLTYSLSVARAISAKAEIVGEFVGRANFAEHRDAGRRGSRPAALRRPLHRSTACASMRAS